MKTAFCVLLIFFTTPFCSGQKGLSEFRLECFSPIVGNGLASYYNDDWSLYPLGTPDSRYNRQYQNIGFSAAYIRHFSKFNAGLRLGFVTRKVDEKSYYYYANDPVEGLFSYRQKHFVSSIFIQRTEKIKFLNVHLGLELPYISYGQGVSTLESKTTHYENGVFWSTQYAFGTITTGSGFATGLGFNLGLSCEIKKHMSLGVELNEYLLYTEFSKPQHTYLEYEMNFYYPEHTDYIKRDYFQIITLKQTAFSRLIPRVYYSINF